MRSLRILGGLDPSSGGPPVSSLNAAIATHRAGIETSVAVPVPESGAWLADVRQRLSREGIRLYEFSLLRWPGDSARRFGLCSGLRSWLDRARHEFDVVHCHGAWVLPTFCVYLGADRGPAAILTPHESLTDFDIHNSRSAFTRWAKAWLRPRYRNRFDLIVFASALEARDSLSGTEARARTMIIPHPVFDERARRVEPRPAAGQPGALRIGFIGRLHAKKNVGVLIRALSLLPETIRLTIAGDGPERDRLRVLAAECSVADRIAWWGFVQGEDKRRFFRSIDLLALPSEYECFGVAAAEAMSEGLPVLVSPRTGVAEVIAASGGGLVVPSEPAAIAAALGRVLEGGDELHRRGAQAAEAAERAFSFAAHGTAVRRAYEALRDSRIRSHSAPAESRVAAP